jgi:uncharacterized membrane protein
LWTILHDRGYLVADGPLKIKVSYPVLPWIGVILLGYTAGPLYSRAVASASRFKMLVGLGVTCLGSLAVLRGFNIYGETLPWVVGDSAVQTVMSLEGVWEYEIEGKAPVTLKAGEALFIPAGTVHSAKNVGSGVGSELATYIVAKGKPLVVLSTHRAPGSSQRI